MGDAMYPGKVSPDGEFVWNGQDWEPHQKPEPSAAEWQGEPLQPLLEEGTYSPDGMWVVQGGSWVATTQQSLLKQQARILREQEVHLKELQRNVRNIRSSVSFLAWVVLVGLIISIIVGAAT